MDFLQHFLSEELVYALGWTVIHSLWQAILVALLLGVLMLGLQKNSAKSRYIAYNIGLSTVFFLAIITFLDLYHAGQDAVLHQVTNATAPTTLAAITTPSIEHSKTFFQSFTIYFNEHLPMIVLIWFSGVSFFVLRLLGGLAFIQYLKHNHHYPVTGALRDKLERLMHQIPVYKTIELAESALVKVPMVIGHFKPIILLPLGAVTQLSTKEIEAILAHELAHIARNDYLLNILQSIIEVLFYFNPAVWWISANIRTERENCCDDIAIDLCGNSLTYAKALVSLQEISHTAPALAMPFVGNKNQLLKRVQRILNQPQNRDNIMEKLMATCLLIIVIGVFSIKANTTAQAQVTKATTLEINDIINNKLQQVDPTFLDSIPFTKSCLFCYTTLKDGQTIEFDKKGDEVTFLKIEDEVIPETEWAEHHQLIKELSAEFDAKRSIFTAQLNEKPKAKKVQLFVDEDEFGHKSISFQNQSCGKTKGGPMPITPKPFPFKVTDKNSIQGVEIQEGITGEKVMVFKNKTGNEIQRIPLYGNSIVYSNGKNTLPKITAALDIINNSKTIVVNQAEEGNALFDSDTIPSLFSNGEPVTYPNEEASKKMEQYLLKHQQAMEAHHHAMEDSRARALQNFHHHQQAYQAQIQTYINNGNLDPETLNQLIETASEAFEIQTEAYHEALEAATEEADAFMQIADDELERFTEQQHESMELFHEQQHRNMELFHEQEQKRHDDISAILAKELVKDGLIDDPENYKFSIKNQKLKINGKKQPDHVYKKYAKLYESLTGADIEHSNFQITRNTLF